MAIEKLSVILELVSGNYQREARNAANATGQIGNSAKSVTGQLGAMIGPAAIGGAILGLGKMALAAGENADRLFDLQAQTGLSTDALQEWEFVAKAAGATTEVFSDAVKAVIRNLDGTKGATGAAAKAYEALGISVKDANGNLREGGEITSEVFEKLASMTNITERNALAQDLFGKKWEETISILDLGSEALGNLREEGKKGVVSAQALANSDKFRETWQKFVGAIGPKMNQLLGDAAPLFTGVADALVEVVDQLQPLLDGLGFLSERWTQLKDQGEEMADSDNVIVSGWGRMIGELGILNILTGNYTDLAGAAIDPTVELGDAVTETTTEIHDSWTTLSAAEVALRASIGPTITMLDNQYASHRNVAQAATNQRTALVNLANFQASQLTPIGNIIRLQQELATSQETLTTAQANSKTPADELALAQIAVAEALAAVQSAGLSLNPEEIQAFAQLLITQFGYSEQAVLDTLEALGLIEGWHGVATLDVVFNVLNKSLLDAIEATGDAGLSNTIVQVRAAGGPVRRGQPYLVGEQGPEWMIPDQNGMILPNGAALGGNVTYVTRQGSNIYVQSPMNDVRSDLQYATILASVTNLVEGS